MFNSSKSTTSTGTSEGNLIISLLALRHLPLSSSSATSYQRRFWLKFVVAEKGGDEGYTILLTDMCDVWCRIVDNEAIKVEVIRSHSILTDLCT